MELRASVEIDAPSAAAWAVVGERFGHIGDWAAPITASTLDGELGMGSVRTCRVAGFGPIAPGVIRERLIEFDPERMTLAYESVDGMPSFIESAVNHWSVHARAEHRCDVRSRATVRLRGPIRLVGPLFGWQMLVNAARVMDELRYQVEHGRPHSRKLAAQKVARAV